MKKSDRIRKSWQQTVASAAVVLVGIFGIAAYDLWQQYATSGSADWKIWLFLITAIVFIGILLGVSYLIKQVMLGYAEHSERK